jgi:hypothetical protein
MRVVRTVIDAVKVSSLSLQEVRHLLVNRLNQRFGKIPPRDPRLICDHYGLVMVLVEEPNGLGGSRQKVEAVEMVDVSDLFVDRSIAVKKYGSVCHPKPLHLLSYSKKKQEGVILLSRGFLFKPAKGKRLGRREAQVGSMNHPVSQIEVEATPFAHLFREGLGVMRMSQDYHVKPFLELPPRELPKDLKPALPMRLMIVKSAFLAHPYCNPLANPPPPPPH